MSDKKMNLYQKLLEIRRSVPYLQKVNQGHQYNYVSSSDVIGAVREKMDSLGVLLTPKITNTKVTVTPSGNRQSVLTELFIDFVWRCVESGEELVVPFYAQGVDPHEKGVGKALTYAEKYLLLKQFNIPTDNDDPDFFQQRFDNAPSFITSEQVKELKDATDKLSKLRNVPASNYINQLGLNSFERVTVDQFYPIRSQLQKWLKRANEEAQTNVNAQSSQQANQQSETTLINNDELNELNQIVNAIANARNVNPQKVVDALALNKNFNKLTQDEFIKTKTKLNEWLSQANSGDNQNTQQTNPKKSSEQTGEENKQSSEEENTPTETQEYVLIKKEESKVPSGELIVKLNVEGSDKVVFARSQEAMNQTNLLQEGDRFIAEIERMGKFAFVTSIQSA